MKLENNFNKDYNVEEEYLYNKTYLFILGYATASKYKYTLKALPLARHIHNGQYRHGTVKINGKDVKLPYILHCLKVCATLISLNLPLDSEELDILYTCALLHDSLEDCQCYFPNGGTEYYEIHHFPKDVYTIIKLLSKHQGATTEDLDSYFSDISKNKLALLIKLADRSHNVEDLYNIKNVQKYIDETRRYFINPGGLCSFAKTHYPEISNGIVILKAKILSLTEVTETILNKKDAELKSKDIIISEKNEKIYNQAKEIEVLRKQLENFKKTNISST